jgi:hypothetical protein
MAYGVDLNINRVYQTGNDLDFLNCECTDGNTDFKIVFWVNGVPDIYFKDKNPNMRFHVSFAGKSDWYLWLPESPSTGQPLDKNNISEFIKKIDEAGKVANYVKDHCDEIRLKALKILALKQREKILMKHKTAEKEEEKTDELEL